MRDGIFYVYIHKDISGKVFYVGKGTDKRCIALGGRSNSWKARAESGWDFELLWCGTDEAEALSIESDLILNPPAEWELVNKQDSTKPFSLDLGHLSQYVYYCKSSPSGLRWKVNNGQTNKSKRSAGDIAGYKNNDRWKVSIKGKELMCHRIVVVLHGIPLPVNKVVNHIDNNPSNNNIENLEVVSTIENNRRSKMQTGNGLSTTNTSGVNGVSEVTVNQQNGTIDTYAVAYLNKPNGKRQYKCFNYKKYGKEKAWELAIKFRLDKFKEYYGETNGI